MWKVFHEDKQALANQLLSNVYSCSSLLQYLLAYFHIKIFVRVLEAKSILHVFLANILFCQSSQLDDVVLSRNTNRFGHEEPNDFPSVTLSYTLREESFISFLQSIIPLMWHNMLVNKSSNKQTHTHTHI